MKRVYTKQDLLQAKKELSKLLKTIVKISEEIGEEVIVKLDEGTGFSYMPELPSYKALKGRLDRGDLNKNQERTFKQLINYAYKAGLKPEDLYYDLSRNKFLSVH